MRLSVLRYVFFRVLHNALTDSEIAFSRMTGDNVPFCRRASSASQKSLFRDVEEPFLRPGTASFAPSVRSYGLRNGLFRTAAMPVSVRRTRLSLYRTSGNDVLNKCRVFVNKCLCTARRYILARLVRPALHTGLIHIAFCRRLIRNEDCPALGQPS